MASNISGNAYALTVLSPIKNEFTADEIAYADLIRDRLQDWNARENSPMALVPQTYLCRFFVLDDVYTESLPGADLRSLLGDLLAVASSTFRRNAMPKEDHLKSRYLVFSCNFYGGSQADLDGYLRGMWEAISEDIKAIWSHCYGFDNVGDAGQFIAYIKKCQLDAALFFVGSNDDPLPEQLKALYLKQEFAKFAVANQGLEAAQLRANFQAFTDRVQPTHIAEPTWSAGQYRI
ncbi:hypothetical protein JCM14076_17760 [Methylosoma difficile]